MTLRLVAAGSAVLALAALAAVGAAPRRAHAPARQPATAAPAPIAAVVPAARVVPRAAEPDLRDVPAGIIARAADARALERAPACRGPARRAEGACAPPRDAVEIRWDVGKEP